MKRTIIGYHQDELGDWVADLDCGHGQHVRHDPPLISRLWVLTEDGRQTRLGEQLNCVRCDELEWPENVVAYKQTAEFDELSTPQALLKKHNTKKGVWAKIQVLEGCLRYVIDGLEGREMILTPSNPGIVVPEVWHHVQPLGRVRFFVTFYKRP